MVWKNVYFPDYVREFFNFPEDLWMLNLNSNSIFKLEMKDTLLLLCQSLYL